MNVENDRIGPVAFELRNPFGCRARGDQFHFRFGESVAEAIQNQRLVVNHQQNRHACPPHRPGGASDETVGRTECRWFTTGLMRSNLRLPRQIHGGLFYGLATIRPRSCRRFSAVYGLAKNACALVVTASALPLAGNPLVAITRTSGLISFSACSVAGPSITG